MAPPGFCNRGEVRYGSIGGLEYEVPQSRLYCLCINVALCSTAVQCICRVIRRSSITMKAHTYYIIFGRPPIGGKLPPFPLTAPLVPCWARHVRTSDDDDEASRCSTIQQQQRCAEMCVRHNGRLMDRLIGKLDRARITSPLDTRRAVRHHHLTHSLTHAASCTTPSFHTAPPP